TACCRATSRPWPSTCAGAGWPRWPPRSAVRSAREDPMATTVSADRVIRAPRGTSISCKSWQQEAALRMLMNNLDPEVAERPEELGGYGGSRQGGREPGGLN